MRYFFAFRPLDLATDGIAVKRLVNGLRGRPQIQKMNKIGIRIIDARTELQTQRPDIDVLDFAFLNSDCAGASSDSNSGTLSTSGSQWSENGSETRRWPVSQLLTRQKTMPFVRASPGAAVVYTSGSYP